MIEDIPQPIAFDWDEGNKDKNFLKHGISDELSEQAFKKVGFLSEDPQHSVSEPRLNLIGVTHEGLTLFIVFTIRHNKIRVISSRLANKKERRRYEEEIKKNSQI